MDIKNPLIFIVEDNESYNNLVLTHLKRQKFTNVKTYYSGEDFINNMNLKPDIIIQDYNLEGMNGIQVLKRAKKIYPKVEFIFLSAQESMTVATDTIRYGAFDYVVKDGIVFDRVIDKIKKIILIKKLAMRNRILQVSMIVFFIVVVIIVIAVLFLNKFGYM